MTFRSRLEVTKKNRYRQKKRSVDRKSTLSPPRQGGGQRWGFFFAMLMCVFVTGFIFGLLKCVFQDPRAAASHFNKNIIFKKKKEKRKKNMVLAFKGEIEVFTTNLLLK